MEPQPLSMISGDPQSYEGTWEKLSQVAVKGAEYDSRERQPHPKCLKGTRVNLINYIHGLLDNLEKSQLIWLHGTAGVGKSAVAFTVAERMRYLKVTEQTKIEMRLAGTFFFSRKHTKRCTTGYFFPTLAYQLASRFPSVQEDVSTAIMGNPALLDPDKSLRDQMEGLFLQPLRRLQFRLRGCPPLVYVVDALDECTSETELTDLILLLARALHEPDLPVIHILLTSRSEVHICKAIDKEEVRSLVCMIPVNTSGESVAAIISLDGADVDNDIYIFLEHSFRELQARHPDFPQPPRDQLERLASRAGRRFIVASTMMKFIDDRDHDPRDRLQLMLELTSELLPGTEVNKLYDCILSTCGDPQRAYMQLSIVAALADPLPISQISKLLGPGQGRDVESVLAQLRSFMDIPTDGSLPVNIYHSSVRDYVSDPSNCSFSNTQHVTPHALLAHSSFRLMMQEIPESTALLDVLSDLKRQSQATILLFPQPSLEQLLAFIVQPPEPLQVLLGSLWLRGDCSSDLQPWLETPDGHACLQTQSGKAWLQTQAGEDWLQTPGGLAWLQTGNGRGWLQTRRWRRWLQIPGERGWLHTPLEWLQTWREREWLLTSDRIEWLQNPNGRAWLQTTGGRVWLQSPSGRFWLETTNGKGWLQIPSGQEWLQIPSGQEWLQTSSGRQWVQTQSGRQWLETLSGRQWLETPSGRQWLPTESGQKWSQTMDGKEWLKTLNGREWQKMQSERERLESLSGREWLQTQEGQVWLQTSSGRMWLQNPGGLDWLQTSSGRKWLGTLSGREWLEIMSGREWLDTCPREWLQTPNGRVLLQTPSGQYWLRTWRGQDWLRTPSGQVWLQTPTAREWLQTSSGQEWLQTPDARPWMKTPSAREWLQREWLQSQRGREWLQTQSGQEWLQVPSGRVWMQTQGGRDWLETSSGREWLETLSGQEWLEILSGPEWLDLCPREWLPTQSGRDWLQTPSGQEWLRTSSGQEWLQTLSGREWLQTESEREWLQSLNGREWLQTLIGREWLQTQSGRVWLQRPVAQAWLQTEKGHTWIQTPGGNDWLQTQSGRKWLQTQSGQGWLQTPHGQAWQSTPAASVWVTMEEFSGTLEAIRGYTIVPEFPLPVFQAIQQFKSFPDFLMFSVFLAFRHPHHSTSALSQSCLLPDREIIRAMNAFASFANEARERSRSAPDALKYACQYWAFHLSRAPNPWDDSLNRIFKIFWDRHLLSWLERQWCLKGLRSCLIVLSEGQKLAKSHLSHEHTIASSSSGVWLSL